MAAAATSLTAVQARRPGRLLVSLKDAAVALGVSERHLQRLVQEADVDRRSRWRFGREIVDMTPKGSARRTLRINLAMVVPGCLP